MSRETSMDSGFCANHQLLHYARRSVNAAGVREIPENKSAAACQAFFDTLRRKSESIGRGTPDDAGVLQETDVGFTDNPRLLHRLFEVLGTHKPPSSLQTVPIEKQGDFARVIHRKQDTVLGF